MRLYSSSLKNEEEVDGIYIAQTQIQHDIFLCNCRSYQRMRLVQLQSNGEGTTVGLTRLHLYIIVLELNCFYVSSIYLICIYLAMVRTRTVHAVKYINFRMISSNCGYYMPVALPSVEYLYKFSGLKCW